MTGFSQRQNLIAALEGDTPRAIPYTVNYGDFVANPHDPRWIALFKSGLCPIGYSSTTRDEITNVERIERAETWQGKPATRVILRTQVGEISQLNAAGWVQEYFLKTPSDYRVMEAIVRQTRVIPDAAPFLKTEQEIGDDGITLIGCRRSPMQTILVDYTGLENFAIHISEGFPELFSLAEALEDQLVETCRLIADGPGRYISLLENLTAETWGPRRYHHIHMPVYEKILPILHTGGKKLYAHYDGQLACLKDLVAQTELDGIESLTQAPEGDLPYDQARAAWPDKFIWANINVSLYDLPRRDLQAAVRNMAEAAAPDGRLLAFEISEDLQHNWSESIPVILEELNR